MSVFAVLRVVFGLFLSDSSEVTCLGGACVVEVVVVVELAAVDFDSEPAKAIEQDRRANEQVRDRIRYMITTFNEW